MHPDIVKLLDLQEKDLALTALDERLAELDAEERELNSAVEAAEQNVEAARRAATRAAAQRDELEQKMENHRQHQERRREKLEFVKGRDLAALTAEIDLARSVLANVESEWVRASDQATSAAALIGQAEEAVSQVREAQQEARETLAGRRAEVEAERERAVEARRASTGDVGKLLLMQYERLWSTRHAAVVIPLAGPTCGACFTAVPLNKRSQIRSGVVIGGCETCGVILYAPEEA